MKFQSIILSLGITAFGWILGSTKCQALSGFIPDTSPADIAYDTSSDIVYISGGSSVLRYNLNTQTFLNPINLGGTTLGMDISPDGKTLAVANSSYNSTQNYIDLINLSTGTSSRTYFNLAFDEGGTFTVAYDKSGNILVSSEFQGSGSTPLRKYNPTTNTTTTLGSVRQNSMLSASADHSVIAVAEANSDPAPYGVYHTGDNTYTSNKTDNWFDYEISVSRDGSQLAIPTYGGTFINNSTQTLYTIGQYAGVQPIGAAYSPVANLLYLPFAQTNYIGVYDTTTGLKVGQFTTPNTFSGVGNTAFVQGRTKVASDGSYLFTTQLNGVFYQSLSTPSVPWEINHKSVGLAVGLPVFAGLGFLKSRLSRKSALYQR